MEDRISNLPDSILQHILSLLPMKSAVATSILSTRWTHLWTSIPVLDFGEKFGIDRESEEIAGIINRFLNLHNSNTIQQFRLCFHPGEDDHLSSHAENWIDFAVQKAVRELDLDFSHGFFGKIGSVFDHKQPFKLPSSVYDCDSESLKLCLCDFNPPVTFNGFRSLQTLVFTQVGITTDMVERLVSNCPVLENLSICHCFDHLCRDENDTLMISGTDLPLKRLKVVDSLWFCNELEILAPNLVSFEYCGESVNWNLREISSLVDAFFDLRRGSVGDPAFFIATLLSALSERVEILTLCSWCLQSVDECGPEHITPFHNLKELQLLMEDMAYDDLLNINYFLKKCPCPSLEKLFLQISNNTSDLPANEDDESSTQLEQPFDYNFDLLKTIKVKGFKGLENEIRFVKIFLQKAIVLEYLILIMPHGSHQENGSKDAPSKITKMSMDVLHDQLLLLPKACSHAKIVISEQDDIGLCPTHTDIYE